MANGNLRVCCLADYGNPKPILNDKGEKFTVQNLSDPADYLNSPFLARVRKQMLQGEKPDMCRWCYEIEASGGFTERLGLVSYNKFEDYKSNTDSETGNLIAPEATFLDFAFSNKCNLRCKMCGPEASNQLISEFKALGIFGESVEFDFGKVWDFDSIRPMIERVVPTLERFLIVGGEPLINNDVFRFLECVVNSGRANSIMGRITSNMTMHPAKYLELLKELRAIEMTCSIDGIGETYEYIRFPSQWKKVEANFQALLESGHPNLMVEVTTCFLPWNLHHIPDILDYFFEYEGHPALKSGIPWFNYVIQPSWARADSVPIKYRQEFTQKILRKIDQLRPQTKNQKTNDNLSLLTGLCDLVLKDEDQDLKHFNRFKDFTLRQDALRKIETKKHLTWIGDQN